MEKEVNSDEDKIETIDESGLRVSAKRLCLSIILLILIVLPWLWMSDLFREPKDIQAMHRRFYELEASFRARPEHWSKQKEQVLDILYARNRLLTNQHPTQTFTDIPLEVLMAFFIEDMGMDSLTFPHLAWYPRSNGDYSSLILSRLEKGWGPLKTVLSIELSLLKGKQGYSTEIHQLRRGNRVISTDYAWKYFGQELAHLSALKPILSGMLNLRFFEREVSQGEQEAGGYVSWTTRPRSIPPALDAYTRSSSLNR